MLHIANDCSKTKRENIHICMISTHINHFFVISLLEIDYYFRKQALKERERKREREIEERKRDNKYED
jgi:hypothetical protein